MRVNDRLGVNSATVFGDSCATFMIDAKDRYGPKTVTVLIGVLLAFALVEGLTRMLVPDPYLAFENRIEMFQEDDRTGYKNRPNYRGYAQGTIRIRTNSLGYRGGEVSKQKGPNTFRIVGLGDSVMWGVGVQEENTYLRILEKKLNEQKPAGLQFETVNTAVIGFSLHQELRTMQRDGVALAPDVVLLGFVMNDFYPTEDPFYNLDRFHQPARHDLRRRPYVPMPPPRSYFIRWLRSTLRQVKQARNRPTVSSTSPPLSWPPGSFEARSWPVMQEHFLNLKRVVNEHGCRLLVLVFPLATQVDGDSGHPFPQSLQEDFFRSAGLEYVDLLDALQGKGKIAFRDAMHLTGAGHQLVAESILQALKERGWLAGPGGRTVSDGSRDRAR